MNSWINLTALWQIVVVGLIAGAGLPACSRSAWWRSASPAAAGHRPRRAGSDTSDTLVGGSVPGMIAGGLCFLIVLAAIGWGIVAIYQAGHPHH